jgi:hypothetical protein
MSRSRRNPKKVQESIEKKLKSKIEKKREKARDKAEVIRLRKKNESLRKQLGKL